MWGIVNVTPHFFYSDVEKFNDLVSKDKFQSADQSSKDSSGYWYNWAPSRLVNLGLDLRGGAHVLVEVRLEDVYVERLQAYWPGIRSILRNIKENVGSVKQLKGGDNELLVQIGKEQGLEEAINQISGAKKVFGNSLIEVTKVDESVFAVSLSTAEKNKIDNQTMEQSLEIVRRRVDEAGTREPTIQRQGERRILVQVPGLGSAEELLTLIGRTAKLTFNAVIKDSVVCERPESFGVIVVPSVDRKDICMLLKEKYVVSGAQLTNAQPSFDQNNRPSVSFQFNPAGGRKFGDYTKDNIGKPFAIVLDGEVISAPIIQSHIPGGSGIITGQFSVDESNDLAILLRAGALPASIKVLEQRTVGPELGADSIESGKNAALIAGIFVILFMTLTYGLFGFFANIGLLINISLIFSIMASMGATLTLPGIAGIVLTIGMAVDANVLIFERIREELKDKRRVAAAIELGYEKALTSIIDANVTTFIAAIILFTLGSGPIRGFSVTLGIGIITSVFTAIFFTRLIIYLYLRLRKPKQVVV